MKALFTAIIILLFSFTGISQSITKYKLIITDTMIDYSGKKVRAIAVNNQIPMPTLEFTEGDSVIIEVYNKMHHETSLHWHGLLLPNEQDGVPYLTTAPIKAHSKHNYNFRLKQHGTYWYHSHSMLQEQIGMYGAIVIQPKEKKHHENEDILLLTDWTNEKPEQIERSLHYATDWYMIKKNAVQSYGEAIKEGYLKTKIGNEWKRMHAMDVSDVWYDQFQINGNTDLENKTYQPGDTIRLRVINGSSSTYFWLNYSGGKIMVVASDGMNLVPVEVDRLIIGVSEIYDLKIIVPINGESAEFRITSEDRIGSASYWFGNGIKQTMKQLPRLNYFEGMQMMNDMMKLNGDLKMDEMQMSLQQMDMNMVMYREITEDGETPITLNYSMLRSPVKTNLPEAPERILHFELTGNMNRYVWTVDRKTISETDKILIKGDENVKIIITNNSMMRHPMHLHGHFFRILNGQGDYSPLKNVLDIMPMETDTIEFNASEGYGDWYFHCHILYHMMAGMGKIFRYEDTPSNPQIPDIKKATKKVYHDDQRFYLGAEIGIESNGSDGEISLMNTRWKLEGEWRLGFNNQTGYETESHFGRFIDKNQFAQIYFGWDFRSRTMHHEEHNLFNQQNTKNDRGVACFGLQYTLPFFIVSDFRVDHTGKLRIQFTKHDMAITKRLRAWGMFNTDLEYATGMRYIITKYISASAHYDSDMGLGAGITFTY